MTALTPTSWGAGSGAAAAGAGALLYDYTVVGAAKASIDTNVDGAFAGLLSGAYRVLKVLIYARSDAAAVLASLQVRFNADAAANYDYQIVQGANATASAANGSGATALIPQCPAASDAAGNFGAIEMTIPAYADTVGQKALTLVEALADNTAANATIRAASGRWRNTAAINRILVTQGAANLVIGSRVTVLAY